MSVVTDPGTAKHLATFNAAADHFDGPAVGFWSRHGAATIRIAALEAGETVLDVGCGWGSSAIPAARAVGPCGYVEGIDLAEGMIEKARRKARIEGLANTRFRVQDMTEACYADGSFDCIVSVFSIFFVPDVERQIAKLWRMLKPGGRLVATFWRADAFQPAANIFLAEFARFRPDIAKPTRVWHRYCGNDDLTGLFDRAIGAMPEIYELPDRQPLASSADWWKIALGTGFRWEIVQLDGAELAAFKAAVLGRLAEQKVRELTMNAAVTVIRKTR